MVNSNLRALAPDCLDNTRVLLHILSQQHNGLKVCHFNAQSLYPKIDEFRYIFCDNSMDIICISESWLKPHIQDNLISLPNYTIFRNDRINRTGGGVAVFLKHNLRGRVVASSAIDASIEYVFIEVFVGSSKCLVCTVYKPPSVTDYHSLEEELSCFCHLYEHIVIAGDFNTNILVDSGLVTSLRSMLNTLSLNIVNSLPTHFSDSSATLLDLFIVADTNSVLFHNQLDASAFSRHDLIFLTYNLVATDSLPLSFTYRDFRSINSDQLILDAQEINWSHMFSLSSVDEQVEYFDENVGYLFDTHVPVRTKSSPISNVPWLTDEIINLIKQRNRAYGSWKRFKIPEFWNRYRLLRNIITNKIRLSKTQYYNSKLNMKIPTKNLWNNLKCIGVGKSGGCGVDEDPDILNRMFTDCTTPFNFCGDPCESITDGSFSFINVTDEQVFNAILSIKSKAVGLDNIYPEFIKLLLPCILRYITHLFNSIITTSVFPSKWKLSKVIPMPKPSRSSARDYRPVSLLPFLSKAFERILSVQLNEHIKTHSLLIEFQSGFRPQHSCTSALLKLTDDIRSNISSDLVTVLTLLDFSKAFDRVDHYLLIDKLLLKFGLTRCAGKLVWSYLRGRFQRVVCNGIMSSFLPVSSGVPQGSILGPLLFSCFINDLPDYIKYCEYHIYADDVQLYLSRPLGLFEDLADRFCEDLAAVAEWVKSNKLVLNASKSTAIVIYKYDIDTSCLPPLIIENTIVKYVKVVKNLGILINSVLSWNNHVDSIVAKIYGILRKLSASASFVPQDTRLYLVKTLVAPMLTYGCEIFSNTDSASFKKLQVAHNSAVRYAFGLRRRDHISQYSSSIFSCPLKTYFHYRSLCFLNNVIITRVPGYLSEKIVFLRSTRNLSIMAPHFNCTSSERQFFVQAIRMWNALPLSIKRLYNSRAFKNILFSHLNSVQ